MSDVNKELLDLLDNTIAPNGVVDEKAFNYFYDEYSESLMYIGEPAEDGDDCECPMTNDEHEPECNAGAWSAWNDSSLKHKIFTYGPQRPAGLGNYPKGKSDLPYILAYQAELDEEFAEDLMEEIENYE
jgi:hypothetical protein